jgi:hypothetical protein
VSEDYQSGEFEDGFVLSTETASEYGCMIYTLLGRGWVGSCSAGCLYDMWDGIEVMRARRLRDEFTLGGLAQRRRKGRKKQDDIHIKN